MWTGTIKVTMCTADLQVRLHVRVTNFTDPSLSKAFIMLA